MLLPTPRTSDTNGPGRHGTGGPDLRTVATEIASDTGRVLREPGGAQHPDKRRAGGHSVTIQDVAEHELTLLPTTTTTMDAVASGGSTPSNVTLTDAVVRTELGSVPNPRHMPTPRATRGGSTTELAYGMGGDRVDDDRPQGEVVPGADWGPYSAAVERWERITRPAPPPVRHDGKNGKARLNPELPEWMMGVPHGHITSEEIGLTRAEQLKAAGNGVVPQQAEAAVLALLARAPEALRSLGIGRTAA